MGFEQRTWKERLLRGLGLEGLGLTGGDTGRIAGANSEGRSGTEGSLGRGIKKDGWTEVDENAFKLTPSRIALHRDEQSGAIAQSQSGSLAVSRRSGQKIGIWFDSVIVGVRDSIRARRSCERAGETWIRYALMSREFAKYQRQSGLFRRDRTPLVYELGDSDFRRIRSELQQDRFVCAVVWPDRRGYAQEADKPIVLRYDG